VNAPARHCIQFAAVLLVGLGTALPHAAASAGVGIDPGDIHLNNKLSGGQATTVGVQVRNPGDSEAKFHLLAQPLNGVPQKQVDPKWFTFAPADVTLKGGDKQPITVTLTVPKGTAAGDYLALLTAQLVLPTATGAGAQVGAAVATKLYFTVLPTASSSSSVPVGLAIGGGVVVVLIGGFLLLRRSGVRLRVERSTE
jgi:uncharacterized membrane protein